MVCKDFLFHDKALRLMARDSTLCEKCLCGYEWGQKPKLPKNRKFA